MKYSDLKVLIIDDESLMLEILGSHLTQMKIDSDRIHKCSKALTAINYYKKCKPHIVFLDIQMTDMDGFTVLEDILKLDPNAHVVMLSGSSSFDNVTTALQKGAKGFVAKPYNGKKIIQVIDKFLNEQPMSGGPMSGGMTNHARRSQ